MALPLLLSKSEIKTVKTYRCKILCLKMKLHTTAIVAIYFLLETLPVEAKLHIEQLGLLWMIAKLGQDDPLNKNTVAFLQKIKWSWFIALQGTFLMHSLLDLLWILLILPSRLAYRHLVKSNISEYWCSHWIEEAASQSSWSLFKISHLFLGKWTHPILSTCKNSPSESGGYTGKTHCWDISLLLDSKKITDCDR